MKKIFLFLIAMLVSGGLFSQIVLLNENMDSYTAGSFMGNNNPTWFTTWSGLPGSGEDAQVLTTFARSAPNAASADLTGGQTDCILKLGNRTTGTYELKWWMYVENTKSAYYNIQHSETAGVEWAFEIYFRTNGDIHLYAGGNTINGTYPKAAWFEIKHIIKLNADSIYLYINGTLLSSWPFHWTNSTTTGMNQLGGVDYFAGEESGSGETPGFYFDDILFSQLGTQVPTVVTQAATGVTSSTATLNGTVNANIQSTTASFEYGLTTAYGSSVAAVPATVTGTVATPVTAGLTGLLPGTTYHYRARGVNSVGTSNGLDMTFTTPAIAPAVVTTAATGVNSTGATLNGTVNAGGASTAVTFEYGLTTAYGTIVSGVPGTVTGNTATPVSATITGLTVNTTYHYRVIGVNSMGTSNGYDMTFLTTTCPMPGAPGVISGPVTVCGNSAGNTYTVSPIANATGYNWSLPPGANITSGANTNSITVTFGNTPGTVSVYGSNTCGNGSTASLAVTVNSSPVPTITGPGTMCVNSGYFYYNTDPGMISYNWTVSAGGNITWGQGTNQAQVTWTGSGPQTISVSYPGSSGCNGTSSLQISVTPPPAPATVITGTGTVCEGATGITYSVAPINGALAYVWSLPAGAVVASGAQTSSITVDFATGSVSGPITVYGNNYCGNGTMSPAYAVTVNPLPATPGEIAGPANVCLGDAGVVYTVPAIANATGYEWTVPAGAVIVSGAATNSITVDFPATASSGDITVHGINACGNGPEANLAVMASPVPPAPVISASDNVLTSNATEGNQWYRNGTAITGANAQTYTATQSGEYWDVATVNTCSSDTSNHIFIVITGTRDLQQNAVTVYPNPCNGKFTVKLSSFGKENLTITVINHAGQKVEEMRDVDVNGNLEKNIDLGPAARGIYSVVISSGESTIVRKIVVQ